MASVWYWVLGAGGAFLLYKVGQKVSAGNNLKVSILTPTDFEADIDGFSFTLPIDIVNARNTPLKVKYPLVTLEYEGNHVGSSVGNNTTIPLNAYETTNLEFDMKVSYINLGMNIIPIKNAIQNKTGIKLTVLVHTAFDGIDLPVIKKEITIAGGETATP